MLPTGYEEEWPLRCTGYLDVKNESAAFWLSVLTDIKACGVEDILIACTDNRKGLQK
jgi:putative transposase